MPEYRDARGFLIASTEPAATRSDPEMIQSSITSGKMVLDDEKPTAADLLKNNLLQWARDFMAFEVARKPGPNWLYQHQSWKNGRFDHALLREMKERLGHYDEITQRWVAGSFAPKDTDR